MCFALLHQLRDLICFSDCVIADGGPVSNGRIEKCIYAERGRAGSHSAAKADSGFSQSIGPRLPVQPVHLPLERFNLIGLSGMGSAPGLGRLLDQQDEMDDLLDVSLSALCSASSLLSRLYGGILGGTRALRRVSTEAGGSGCSSSLSL
jgi:hypothetical protein